MQKGTKHSEATRKKISAKAKKRWKDPEQRASYMSTIHSEKARAKRGRAMKKHWKNPETRQKMMRRGKNPRS